MNGHNGQSGQYALGVDLGTSNTVAVLRWPDGRTRPLLFDGQPVVPSGVYLDGRGQLHVGLDAVRLAQAEPAGYEPNPKRRVDESGVLLADREVPTVDMLAAVLGAVARAAVEAVGFLPPAVVTYPAAWGSRRREVLVAAVARAGWPPATLVPEPVAAARYFVDVLRRPVPVGASVAVFDFGGGTLDVAVVRNEGADQAGRPRFAVTSSGGVAELGGLDLDAALVEHLSGLLVGSAPDAWRRISQPQGPGEWRERRRYWDEVRAAKEMLSRSTTAPVAIPGVDRAAHVTRDELERLVMPLLHRGVAETARVVAASGLHPQQLAGLFLVGGSSRVPLVARMLHAELGVAPTVLEQPELPVAEGALAELPSPAPAPAAPPVSPAPPQAPAPPPPAAPKRRPFYRRPVSWLAAGAVVALLALGITWLTLLRNPYPPLEYRPSVGEPVNISMGDDSYYAWSFVSGDVGYLAWQDKDDQMLVRAVNLPAGDERWHATVPAPTDDGWKTIIGFADGIALVPYRRYATAAPVTVLRGPGERDRWTVSLGYDDSLTFFDKTAVLDDRSNKRLVFLNATSGAVIRSEPDPNSESSGAPTILVARTPADYAGPDGAGDNTPAYVPNWGDDTRLVQVTGDRSVRVFDATTGNIVASRPNVADPDDELLAYDGKLYVGGAQAGYQIVSYALDALKAEPKTIYQTTDKKRALIDYAPCGEDRLCALDRISSDDNTTELVALDTKKGGDRWHKPARGMESVTQVADRALVRGGSRFQLWTPDGKVLDRAGTAARVDGGNVLMFAAPLSASTASLSVAGFGVRSGKAPVELGLLKDAKGDGCSWNSSVIICPGTKEFHIWRFAGN